MKTKNYIHFKRTLLASFHLIKNNRVLSFISENHLKKTGFKFVLIEDKNHI